LEASWNNWPGKQQKTWMKPVFLSPNSDKIPAEKKNSFEINGLACRLIATPVFG